MCKIQCDNGKPFCKKCTDSGRKCAGYERETVFIIGTLEDGGRCSSHPPRVIRSKKDKNASVKAERAAEKPDLVPAQPLQPAWDDLISVSDGSVVQHVQIAALHTNLETVGRQTGKDDANKFAMSFDPYRLADLRPTGGEDDFELRCQYMVHLAPATDTHNPGSETVTTDSIFLFLYEVCTALSQ